MGRSKETSFAHIQNNTKGSWWLDSGLRRNVFHCLGICLCPFYLGYDQSLLAGLQALPKWKAYFGKPAGTKLGFIAASIFLPALIAAFVGDLLCNKFGRRKIILVGSVLIIIGAIWNALSQNTAQFIGSRVIIGSGGAITKVAAPALLQEIAHPRLRGTLGTSYYPFYYWGSILSGCMCIAGYYMKSEWQWRLPCIVQIVGPIAVLSIVSFAPESPRWLIKQGRDEEARAIMIKHHANGDTLDPLVQWQYEEIKASLHAESLLGPSSYMDFFRTPGNRKRLWVNCLLGLGSNWVGNGIITYYLAPVLATVGIKQTNIVLGINAGYAGWDWLCAVGGSLISEKAGRRFLWLTCHIGMGLSFCFVMGLSAGFAHSHNSSVGVAVVPFLFIVHAFYDIGYITLNYSYTVEIMPYNLRTKGLALYIFFNNAGNAFNQFVNPIALAALTWKYYAVYIAVDLALAVVVYFFFPETKQMTIEEISMVFDYPTFNAREKVLEAMEQKRTEEHREQENNEPYDETKKTDIVHVENMA